MKIIRGRVLLQRFFDIADEIKLVEAEQCMRSLSRRWGFIKNTKHVQLPNPPLEVLMSQQSCGVEPVGLCEATVRIYDMGALVVTYAVPIVPDTTPEGLIDLACIIWEHQDRITEAAQKICKDVADVIMPACVAGGTPDIVEDYTIYALQETQPKYMGNSILNDLDIGRLFLGEKEALAESGKQHFLHAVYSYRPDDLVVVDWNSALLVDPTASHDIAELLELATVQLLELRAYEHIVGQSLRNLYDELGRPTSLFQSSKYLALSRRIMRRYVEISEIADRIDNSLKLIGDTYLARIHRAAVQEFQINRWHQTLREKLEVLRQMNEMILDQVTSTKSFRVEFAVVILIVLEILFAIFKIT